ncbi:MAG: hypothetical protein ACI8RZ_005526, partial [Myxococcota bacterium]
GHRSGSCRRGRTPDSLAAPEAASDPRLGTSAVALEWTPTGSAARTAEGTRSDQSPRTETGLESPLSFKDSPISAFDSADLSCSPFGLLSQGRSQPRGDGFRRVLPHPWAENRHPPRHAFSGRCAEVSIPSGLDSSACSRGLHFLRSPLCSGSLQSPLPCDPQPDTSPRSPVLPAQRTQHDTRALHHPPQAHRTVLYTSERRVVHKARSP